MEQTNKQTKKYCLLYRGTPVTEVTVRKDKTLTHAKAYEIAEAILRKQKPNEWVWKEFLMVKEIA